MRTTTTTTTGQALTIGYPNSVAFMYSPQLVRVTGLAPDFAKITVTLTHVGSGRQHAETRAFHDGSVRFDISRIMQLLAPDVDEISKRLGDEAPSFAEPFLLSVSFDTGQMKTPLLDPQAEIIGMYGALDQGETYGEGFQRRLWVNFPQTFNLWADELPSQGFTFPPSAFVSAVRTPKDPCNEYDLMQTLQKNGFDNIIKTLRSGAPTKVWFTWRYEIKDGNEREVLTKRGTLIPDCSGRNDGTYLRWLNRRGEMSYWLFVNSKQRVTTSATDTFVRYYPGDPTVPEGNVFGNPQKASFREAREMVLGAVGLSREEYDELCDLASSPVVERLMPGEDSTTWQRVNVVAGTFERNIRRMTPSRQELEFVIELPERNTIQL